MSDFVYDNTDLADDKADASPPSGPTSQRVTADEWNELCQAVKDLRDAVKTGDYHGLANTSSVVGSAGTARMRAVLGRLQVSENGASYRHALPPPKVIDVRDFGVKADGVTDDLPALQAALASLSTAPSGLGGVLQLPAGDIIISDTWNINKEVVIRGTSGGPNASTRIKNAANKTAIRFCSGDVAFALGMVGGPSDGSTIEHVMIAPDSPSGTDQHGIEARVRVTIRNCSFFNLGGKGIWIYTNGAIASNANGWRIDNCFLSLIQGDAVHVDGGDTNGGVGSGIYAISVQGWGVHDSTFLGSAWFGCLMEACYDGAFFVEEAAALSTIVGCYSEGGYPPSVVNNNTVVIGGDHGAGIEGGITIGAYTNQFRTRSNPTGPKPAELQWGFPAFDALGGISVTGDNQALYWMRDPDTARNMYIWQYGQSSVTQQAIAMSGENAQAAGTSGRPLLPARTLFPQGFFVGEKYIVNLDAVPSTGSWEVGDVVRLNTPTAGEFSEYECVTAGTFGTYTEGRTLTGAFAHYIISGGANTELVPGVWFSKAGDPFRVQRIHPWRAEETVTAPYMYRRNGSNVYRCVTSGVTDDTGASGPTGTGTGIADGTAVWDYVGTTAETILCNALTSGGGHVPTFITPVFQRRGALTGGIGDSTAAPGNATLNTRKGRSAIAAGAAAVTITNSKVTASSIVTAVLQTNDGTLTQILRVVPASGSFTITGNANATGTTVVAWVLEE